MMKDMYKIEWLKENGFACLNDELNNEPKDGRSHIHINRLQNFIDELTAISGVTVYGTGDANKQTATIAMNIAGLSPSEAGLKLDQNFGILCRVGLHCSPAAHRTIGTFPTGTVRFAPGPFTTQENLQQTIEAVRTLAKEGKR